MLTRTRTSGREALARMRADPVWRRRVLGLAVLIGLVAGVPLATIKPNPFHHPHVVHAVFDEAVGISLVQRDVRMAGVKVGRIGEVRRVGDDAEIELLIDEDVGEIHRDARAALRPHHPFEGTAFIDLDPGSASAPPLGDHVIPKAHTTTYVSLDQALRWADAPSRAAFKRIVAELVPALGPAGQKGVGKLLDNAPALLRNTIYAVRALRGPAHPNQRDGRAGDSLRRLVPAMSATVDAVAGDNDQLGRAVANARRTLDALAVKDARPVDSTLARLPATLASVDPASRAGERVLDQAERLAHEVVPSLREMVPTTRAALPVLRQMRPTLRALPEVVANIRGTLTELAAAQPAFDAVFGGLAPTGKRMRYSLGPALRADSALGQPTYLQFGSALTGLTGLLSSFQTLKANPIGAGHGLRGPLDLLGGTQGPPESLPVPCSRFATLNPDFATAARRAGICTP
jgi:ABC-type transporter Mla subunit MlaD